MDGTVKQNALAEHGWKTDEAGSKAGDRGDDRRRYTKGKQRRKP